MPADYGQWELIDGRGLCGDTYRMKVPHGYLYRERECAARDGVTTALALTFAPDLNRTFFVDDSK